MSKIEEVARAICENVTAASPDDIIPEHPHGSRKRWQAYEYAARAAIEAMRNPTEKMSDEGAANNFGKPSYAAWQAMIDAALNEQVTG